MGRYLNHEMTFEDVRWRISKEFSDDFRLTFRGEPVKRVVKQGTILSRLIIIPTDTVLEGVWWMPKKIFDRLREENNNSSDGDGVKLRNLIAQAFAVPLADSKLSIAEIELVQPVYAWEGMAAPLFGRPGGSNQLYLPNLSEPGNPGHSRHARILRTYWLRF